MMRICRMFGMGGKVGNWVEDKNGAWRWVLLEEISKMQTLDMVAI
jgi:hypothetical protein